MASVLTVCISALFLSSLDLCRCEENCIVFRDNRDVIEAPKGSYVPLTFSVVSECFPDHATYVEMVTVDNVTDNSEQAYCQLVFVKGQCPMHRYQDCNCLPETREYQAKLQMSSTAQCETWRVKIQFGKSEATLSKRVNIVLNEHSGPTAPKVERVTIRQDKREAPPPASTSSHPNHRTTTPATASVAAAAANDNDDDDEGKEEEEEVVVEQGSRVTVTCVWDDGKPHGRAARLIRQRRKSDGGGGGGGAAGESREELLSTVTDKYRDHRCFRRMSYVIEEAQCHDMGKLKCEVPGATTHLSRALLVKCPPYFLNGNGSVVSTRIGDRVAFDLPVRVPQKVIVTCWLARLTISTTGHKSTHGPNPLPASTAPCEQTELVGELPDLILRVWMTNVTRASVEGWWRIQVTNQWGNGTLDFFLQREDSESMSMMLIGGLALGYFVVTVVIIIVCIVRQRKKDTSQWNGHPPVDRRRLPQPPPLRRHPDIQRWQRSGNSERGSSGGGGGWGDGDGGDIYNDCLPSEVGGLESIECDSCLIDRIYTEIKEHATRID
ncbi:uncharacterized protein LOC143274786 [Babylonia areolata]|uniref:uncharacterized protein LOC143274786 n=1 Tax=Babylonia areolata TaxID=304850 RepID=UPI003FD30322